MSIKMRGSWKDVLKNKESIEYKPQRVCISMKQGNAPLAKTVVQEGQYVCCGELIGKSETENFCVYASISGVVERIFNERISVSETAEHVVIYRQEKDCVLPVRFLDINLENFKKMGIVATLGENKAFFDYCQQILVKDTLNLLAFDREPGEFAEYRLIMECTSKILFGAKCLAEIYKIHQLNIYITSEEVSHILKKHIQRFVKTLTPLKTFNIYTMNCKPYEQHFRLTKKEGIWCTPTDLCRVYSGFFDDVPSTTCMVTVGGCAALPGNYAVPNGTYVRDLLNFCKVNVTKDFWIVVGGIMRGHCVPMETAAVSLNVQSLWVIPAKERKELPCVSCRRCKRVCPAGLDPAKIQRGTLPNAKDCVECGLCSYVCPSDRSLKERVKASKKQGGVKSEFEKKDYVEIDDALAKQLEPLVVTSQSGPYIHGALHLKNVLDYAVVSTGAILAVCTLFFSVLYLFGTVIGTCVFYGLSRFFGNRKLLLWEKSFLISAVSVVTIGTVTGGLWWVTTLLWGNIIACILRLYIL